MKKEFIVTEVFKQKRYYTVQATSKKEAVEKVLCENRDAHLYDIQTLKNWKPVAVLNDEVPEEL